jgi:hypothetical protein
VVRIRQSPRHRCDLLGLQVEFYGRQLPGRRGDWSFAN